MEDLSETGLASQIVEDPSGARPYPPSFMDRFMDAAQMAEMDQFDHALAALNAERDARNKIPTLPWRGTTLRGFLTTIALPIVLFVLQTMIARLLV